MATPVPVVVCTRAVCVQYKSHGALPVCPSYRGPAADGAEADDMSPPWTTLPQAILATIAAFVPSNDFPSYRLACKDWRSAVPIDRLHIDVETQGNEFVLLVCGDGLDTSSVKTVALSGVGADVDPDVWRAVIGVVGRHCPLLTDVTLTVTPPVACFHADWGDQEEEREEIERRAVDLSDIVCECLNALGRRCKELRKVAVVIDPFPGGDDERTCAVCSSFLLLNVCRDLSCERVTHLDLRVEGNLNRTFFYAFESDLVRFESDVSLPSLRFLSLRNTRLNVLDMFDDVFRGPSMETTTWSCSTRHGDKRHHVTYRHADRALNVRVHDDDEGEDRDIDVDCCAVDLVCEHLAELFSRTKTLRLEYTDGNGRALEMGSDRHQHESVRRVGAVHRGRRVLPGLSGASRTAAAPGRLPAVLGRAAAPVRSRGRGGRRGRRGGT